MNRRSLLQMTAAASTAAAVGPLAHAKNDRPVTVILVHGANGSAAVWSPVVRELTARGHRALPVDLPGHGPDGWFPLSYQEPQDLAAFAAAPSPLAGVTLGDNVALVTDFVRRAAAHGPVVLAGQSLGGITITAVAEAVPHLISRLVYVSAFCCTKLTSVYDCYTTPEGSTSAVLTLPKVGDPFQTGALRTNWRSADPAFLAAAKEAFLGDGTDDQVRALLATCQPDEAAILSISTPDPTPARWGRVPRTFLRLTEDRSIPLALQDRMIREADAFTPHNRFHTATLPTSHLGWLYRPAEVADVLAG